MVVLKRIDCVLTIHDLDHIIRFIDHLMSKSPIILLGSCTLLGQLNHDLVLAMTANKVIKIYYIPILLKL